MITNSKLLIDLDCTMCKLYGKAFLKLGLIEKDVLSSYQQIEKSISDSIDMERAKSEIALINLKNNQVEYGIDAFTRILTKEKSIPRALIRIQPFRLLFKLLYSIISWNRHIITRPASTCSSPICTPDLHLGYRITYNLITALLTGFILSNYFSSLFLSSGIVLPTFFEYVVCFGQIFFQGTIVTAIDKEKAWDYLGHMSTISMIGALLLLPPYVIAGILGLSSIYLLGAFGLVVIIMIQEHILRSKRLGLGHTLTATWVFYRMLILLFILILSL